MAGNLNWKSHRIFYGWWVVVACFFISLYTGGVVFFGFTAFFEPLADKFGWTYMQISFAASLRGMEAGLLAPLVGILVDRWGPRKLLFGGAIISSLGLILLSRINSLAMFYGASLVLGVGVSVCSSTVLMTAVVNWFNRKIGIATGIVMSGYGFGGLLIPVIVRLIETYGWQEALTILTIGMLVLCLPLSLLVRHKPEQYGHQPDGEVEDTLTSSSNSTQGKIAEVTSGTKQALKSRTFWHIALLILSQAIVVSAIVAHIMPYLVSIQIARREAGLIASAVPLISVVGRLGLGWLGDRLDKRRVMAIASAMMCGGLLCFAFVSFDTMWLLVPFLILFGIGFGGTTTLRASVVREFFDRESFGVVLGLLLGMVALGTIAGPPLAGWVFDNWGSYQPVWLVFAGLAIAATLIAITIPIVSSASQRADEP